MTDKVKTPDQVIHCEVFGWRGPFPHSEHTHVFFKGSHADQKTWHGNPPNYAKDLRPVFEWMSAEGSRSFSFDKFLRMEKNISLYQFMFKTDNAEQRDLIAQWIESTRECVA